MSSGTVLENLSNRKLFALFSILSAIQVAAFIVGGFYTPSPSITEQFLATKCIPENRDELSIPRFYLPNGDAIRKNCLVSDQNANQSIVFAFQMPPVREGFQLDYSRWMSYIVALLTPDFVYEESLASSSVSDSTINGTIVMRVRLAVASRFKPGWKVYAQKDKLYRTISCTLEPHMRKSGHKFDCETMQLFELQSIYYDYYLLNMEIVAEQHNRVFSAILQDLNLIVIHQNGGFTQIWLGLKIFFTFISGAALIFFVVRLRQLQRPSNLIERFLLLLGFMLFQLNLPIESLTLWFDLSFMNFLNDLRQGAFYCVLFCFWLVFVGEHSLQDTPLQRSALSLYYRQLLIVFSGSLALFVFDSAERGVQAWDPFFTIWEVQSIFPNVLLAAGLLCGLAYLVYLFWRIIQIFKIISGRQRTLPRMPMARRLTYHGVIYRFKFLLYSTGFCGLCTIVSFFYSQIREEQWLSQLEDDPPIQYGSAMFASVYALWNCYVALLLCMYAPSAKCLEVDNASEEIEFSRLGDSLEDVAGSEPTASSSTPRSSRRNQRTPKKHGKPSELQLFTDMTTKPSFD